MKLNSRAGVEVAKAAVAAGMTLEEVSTKVSYLSVNHQRALAEYYGDDVARAMCGKARNCVIGQVIGASKKCFWLPEEDEAIRKHVSANGPKHWREVAQHLPGRNEARCRERWCQHLDPAINKGPWSPDEDRILKEEH